MLYNSFIVHGHCIMSYMQSRVDTNAFVSLDSAQLQTLALLLSLSLTNFRAYVDII